MTNTTSLKAISKHGDTNGGGFSIGGGFCPWSVILTFGSLLADLKMILS